MRQHTLLSLSLISNKTINTSIKEILNIKSKFWTTKLRLIKNLLNHIDTSATQCKQFYLQISPRITMFSLKSWSQSTLTVAV
jgi:hypothetical protein